jgi:plasmid stabilization system protein ParE
MKVRYTLRAFAERERIFEYLDARNPKAAHAVVGLIKQRIEELGEQPNKGRRTNRPGIIRSGSRPIGSAFSTASISMMTRSS